MKLRDRLALRTLLALNRLLPPREVHGRESPEAYAQMEYEAADWNLALYGGLAPLHDTVVLDAGCGLGGKTVRYAELGVRSIVGVDIDPDYIRAATAFAERKGAAHVRFSVAALDALEFEDDSFDVIFLDDVLEHVLRPSVEPSLSECRRVLRPGGSLCLTFSPWTAHDAGHLYDHIHIPWCHLLFSDATLDAAVAELRTAPSAGERDVLDYFHELNRLEHEDFERIVRTLDFRVISLRRRMIRDASILARVPLLRRYLTSRTVAVLSK